MVGEATFRGVCQCTSALEALDPDESVPCTTCMLKQTCWVYGQLNFLSHHANHGGSVRKLFTVTKCEQKLPKFVSDKPADIRGSLRRAGVKHVCDGCGEGAAGNCFELLGLEDIKHRARYNGMGIEIETTTCASVRPDSEKLLQINELRPAKTAQVLPAKILSGSEAAKEAAESGPCRSLDRNPLD